MERLEDSRALLRRNACSTVLDCEQRRVAARGHLNSCRAASVPPRVVEQVAQHATQQCGIAAYYDGLPFDTAVEIRRFLRSQRQKIDILGALESLQRIEAAR